MKNSLPGILSGGLMALLAVGLLVWWTGTGPAARVELRIPGLDRLTEGVVNTPKRPLVGTLARFDGQPADLPGDWPWFRGRQLDGIGHDDVKLAQAWPEGGLDTLWSLELGEGHAGAAVFDGRVYVLDYDRQAEADALRCFSLADGREIWRFGYPVVIKRNHGMSRTIPAVTERYVISIGPKCHVACLDRTTGEELWLKDMAEWFGATVPPWYAAQCPLVEDDRLILAPGGDDVLMAAVDCQTGEVLWRTPNPRAWKMTHVSIVPMELAGRRMYVYCGSGGVAGVAADDGRLLWDTTDWKISIATVPSPVVLPEGKIFCSGGYNSGAVMLQVKPTDEGFAVETLFRLKPKVFGSTQHTPIYYNGHLYGVREIDRQLVCLDLDGNEVWASGRQHRFGSGPYLIADGLIYVMDDHGVLTLAEATPDGYNQLAQAKVLDGHDSWGPMALVHGRLIVRDLTRMKCLDVGEK